MKPEVFKVVCVPLLGINHTALLAISTPDDEFNYYSELFQMRNADGFPLFKLISIGLSCQACLEANIACLHKLDKLPHWKSVERQALTNAILGSDTDLADRETRGVTKASSEHVFEREWVKKLGEREKYKWDYTPNVLWMAIDPAGGGNQSDFAVSTMGYENARHVIVGLDSTNTHKHNVVINMLETHLKNLRATPRYKECVIYVFIEANYGGYWASDIVARIVQQDQFLPVEVVSYDETGKARDGIWMKEEVKRCMSEAMQRSLADGQLCFAEEFITMNVRGKRHEQCVKDKQTSYREQLVNYRAEKIKPADEATGITKVVMTGKTNSGRKDDLCICSQIALYFSGKKRLEQGFRRTAHDRGWRY